MKPRYSRVSQGWNHNRHSRGRTHRKHLISLVEDEHLHAVGLEEAALDHVVDTAGGADNNLGAVLEGLHVITNAGAANAGVALNVHEVTNGDDDLLDLLGQLTGGSENQSLALLQGGVDLLQHRDGEGGSLASTGLGLGDDIVTWLGCQWPVLLRCGCEGCRGLPLMTGMMARCWIADGRSKP